MKRVETAGGAPGRGEPRTNVHLLGLPWIRLDSPGALLGWELPPQPMVAVSFTRVQKGAEVFIE